LSSPRGNVRVAAECVPEILVVPIDLESGLGRSFPPTKNPTETIVVPKLLSHI
jgi:hypothetical protein